MRKYITTAILIFFLIASLISLPVQAAYNDFAADGNITVTGVAGSGITADLTIMSGSTAESWSVSDGGIFTVTVADGSHFYVTCSNNSVLAINYTINGYTNCLDNSSPSVSTVHLFGVGTFTVAPKSTNCSGGSGVILPPSGGGGGGSTPTPTPTVEPTPAPTTATPSPTATAAGEPAKDSQGNVTLGQMTADAETVASADVSKVIAKMGITRDLASESKYNQEVVAKITGSGAASAAIKNSLVNFVTYGTPATKTLGAGERGGVVNSFQAAFGKLPATQSDWNDVIKIANGRWPSQKSEQAESKAKINFEKVYLHEANMSNARDNAAITVMAYGLRPAKRNLGSEKAAIKSFKAIYGYNPLKATAWDVVRAIAYSGATR